MGRSWRFMLAALAASAIVAGLLWTVVTAQQNTAPLPPRPAVTELERQIGQMILVGFTGRTPDDYGVRMVGAQLADGTIGGVLLLGRNIETSNQLRDLTTYLSGQRPDPPVLIAIDQEGGQVQRLRGIDRFPTWLSARRIADAVRAGDKGAALRHYTDVASALPSLGINLNFGPVVDLNLNPENPVIGAVDRSYGADADTVTQLAGAFVDGHRAARVLTSLKHFPGHGSSAEDSHKTLPDISRSWRPAELGPYEQLSRAEKVDMVMMGHLLHPRFSDGPAMPASLSRKGVAAARDTVGPAAVVITDDLDMDAVSDRATPEEAAVRAIFAGNDMVIVSRYNRSDPGIGDRINAAIRDAVTRGRISRAQLDASIARIAAMTSRLAPTS